MAHTLPRPIRSFLYLQCAIKTFHPFAMLNFCISIDLQLRATVFINYKNIRNYQLKKTFMSYMTILSCSVMIFLQSFSIQIYNPFHLFYIQSYVSVLVDSMIVSSSLLQLHVINCGTQIMHSYFSFMELRVHVSFLSVFLL